MNLENYYWYFKDALSPRFCDEVIKYSLYQNEMLAKTGGFNKVKDLSKDQLKQLKSKRNSDVVWLNDHWIYKEIMPFVKIANQNAGWNFQFDFTESCQFTKYKLNQYYYCHCYSWNKPYSTNDNTNGKIRKLSMTCQLTDGSEYTGGELEFDFRNYDPPMRDEEKHLSRCNEILSKGSIIVFPSFVWHRVKPVRQVLDIVL